MALIICKECGREISNKATACPHCGAPIMGDEISALQKVNIELADDMAETEKPKQKTSYEKNGDKKHNCKEYSNGKRKKSKALMVLKYVGLIYLGLVVFFIIVFGVFGSNSKKSDSSTSDNSNLEQAEVKTQTETITLFEQDLLDGWDNYVGKNVQTTIIFEYYYSSDKRIRGKSLYSYAGDNSVTDEIEVYLDNKIDKKDYDSGDFITVSGTVSEEKYKLEDCEIINSGATAEESFNALYAPYKEKLEELAKANEEEFRNGELETPTYEELLRYPGTYQDKRIKVTVYISEKEADGVILDGTIWGTYEGQQVVVVDKRSTKEPEILTGDTLTIYGYGDGTTTVKTYVKGTGLLGSDLGADVVDKTEIPKIKIVYCDFN